MRPEVTRRALGTAIARFLRECDHEGVELPSPDGWTVRVLDLWEPRAPEGPIRLTLDCEGERVDVEVTLSIIGSSDG